MRKVGNLELWLGNAADLHNPRAILATGIEAVVELADSEPFAVLPRDLIRCRFPLSEGGCNPPWLLRLAAESVATLVRSAVPVLVCCSAGISRSVCVVAGAIVLIEDRSLADALACVIGPGPADVSPGLVVQLQQALGR